MVAFANTTRHNLLSFQFVHRILILVLGVQVLFAGNESHEDIVADCGGGNIRTRCIKLRVAELLPVLSPGDSFGGFSCLNLEGPDNLELLPIIVYFVFCDGFYISFDGFLGGW